MDDVNHPSVILDIRYDFYSLIRNNKLVPASLTVDLNVTSVGV